MDYEYLEHTAEIKFKAYGKSPEELFDNSGKALCNAVISLKSIQKKGKALIELKADTQEELLFKFLSEILFLIDAKEFIFSSFKIRIKQKEKIFFLNAECFGEKIDLKKHEIKTEIKAITKHEFSITKKENGFAAEVLVDV